jgi:hypothetical protein
LDRVVWAHSLYSPSRSAVARAWWRRARLIWRCSPRPRWLSRRTQPQGPEPRPAPFSIRAPSLRITSASWPLRYLKYNPGRQSLFRSRDVNERGQQFKKNPRAKYTFVLNEASDSQRNGPSQKGGKLGLVVSRAFNAGASRHDFRTRSANDCSGVLQHPFTLCLKPSSVAPLAGCDSHTPPADCLPGGVFSLVGRQSPPRRAALIRALDAPAIVNSAGTH